MACCNESQLLAYLDGEISFRDRREMDNHLESCEKCRSSLSALKENKDFVSAQLGQWGAEVSTSRINAKAAWSQFALSNRPRLTSAKKTMGGLTLQTRFKKLAVAISAVLVLGLAMTSSTVRAAASDFLTLFRVEKVQTISINTQQLQNVARVFREKGISLNIENFGQVTNNGVGQPQEISLAEAEKQTDFNLLTPAYLPFANPASRVTFSKAGSIGFQLNVKNVNNMITSLGGKNLLPEQLDNQKFDIQVPNAVAQVYRTVDGSGQTMARVTVTQFRSPEITAPAGVDVEQMREAILSLPVIPDDIRKQLASIKDWRSTLVIPVPEGQAREIQVGTQSALYTQYPGPGKAQSGTLVWESQGVITLVEGSVTEAELVKVAENLQ